MCHLNDTQYDAWFDTRRFPNASDDDVASSESRFDDVSSSMSSDDDGSSIGNDDEQTTTACLSNTCTTFGNLSAQVSLYAHENGFTISRSCRTFSDGLFEAQFCSWGATKCGEVPWGNQRVLSRSSSLVHALKEEALLSTALAS